MKRIDRRLTALLLAAALLLPACSGGVAATTMKLAKTAGTVGVSDEEGRDVTPAENLGLYSGYAVATETESYAWVNLDDVKLTKLDEDTEIEITKDGKKLEIEVKSGALFFNITEPLADDETLDIRTATMVVGIRGTCGWVEVPDAEHMTVYILEGTVEVTAGESSAAVTAGEMAELSETGEEPVVVRQFSAAEVKPFVQEAAEQSLLAELPETPDSETEALAGNRLIDGGIWNDIITSGDNVEIFGGAVTGNIITSSGNVTVSGGSVTGDIITASGNVTVSGGAVTGDIVTASGNVEVSGGAGTGNITTTSGNIAVYDGTKVGVLSTESGAIQDNR